MELQSLQQAVARALESGQVGTPVAARVVDHGASDPQGIEPRLAHLLALASQWMGAEPVRISAGGSIESGQRTALVLLAGGQSLLVSVGVLGQSPRAVSVLIFGSRGILSWESDAIAADNETESPANVLPLAERCRQVLRQAQTMDATVMWSGETLRATPLLHGGSPRKMALDPLALTRSYPRQSPPFGVLLVSGDHTHQPWYAAAFAADPRCRLVGLSDEEQVSERRAQLNRRLADRLGIPLLPRLQEALTRDDVQIVSICAEPYRRGPLIVRAAEAGKQLFLDKPLCGSLDDADAVVEAVQRAGVQSAMFSQVGWEAAQRALRQMRSARLGDLSAVHFDLCFAKGPAGTADLKSARRETAVPQRFEVADCKRELTNVGVYEVVQLMWMLRRRVRTVVATTGNYFFVQHQRHDMEDFGQLLLELDDGTIATITTGRTGWCSHPGGGVDRVHLVGTRRSVLVDAYGPRIEVWSDTEPWVAPPNDPEDPMGMWAPLPDSPYRALPKTAWLRARDPSWQTNISQFLDCLEQGRANDVAADLAAAATEVLFAAYQSAAQGCPVSLRQS